MDYYALFYDVIDDFVNRRTPFRQQHLTQVGEARARGDLVLAGALDEPADRALLVFLVDDKRKVETFARNDPYVRNGLVKKWEVRPWKIVTSNEATVAPRASSSGQIVRLWSARTSEANWPRYHKHFSDAVLPELRLIQGYSGAALHVRREKDAVEILVTTFWKSLDAVRAFSGVNLDDAVVAESAAANLTSYDRQVRHYETVLTDTNQNA